MSTTTQRKYGREFWIEYLDKLYNVNKIFESSLQNFANNYLSGNINVKISDRFDLISFLRSFKVSCELIWPTDDNLVKQYEAHKKGRCKKLDFKLACKSQNSDDVYSVVLAYEAYNLKGKILFFPTTVIHSCDRTDYLFISLGYVPIICKHVYSAIRKVAEENEKRNIPIDTTILSTLPTYVWDVLRIAENSRIPIFERLRDTYFKLIGYIYLNSNNPVTRNFVWSIIRTNKTIEYLTLR